MKSQKVLASHKKHDWIALCFYYSEMFQFGKIMNGTINYVLKGLDSTTLEAKHTKKKM